jgi:hypothetical protein
MRLADRLRVFLASGLLTMEKHYQFAEKRDHLVTPAPAFAGINSGGSPENRLFLKLSG